MERPEKSEEVYSGLRKLYFEGNLTDESEEVNEDIFHCLEEFSRTGEGIEFSLDELVNTWESLWEDEVGMELSPENKKKEFIESFIEAYLSKVGESTIHEMLVKDFFHGVRSLCMSESVDDWLDMWFLTLKQNYESVESPGQIAENALERMSLKKK